MQHRDTKLQNNNDNNNNNPSLCSTFYPETKKITPSVTLYNQKVKEQDTWEPTLLQVYIL